MTMPHDPRIDYTSLIDTLIKSAPSRVIHRIDYYVEYGPHYDRIIYDDTRRRDIWGYVITDDSFGDAAHRSDIKRGDVFSVNEWTGKIRALKSRRPPRQTGHDIGVSRGNMFDKTFVINLNKDIRYLR